jgi:hypothetical protein
MDLTSALPSRPLGYAAGTLLEPARALEQVLKHQRAVICVRWFGLTVISRSFQLKGTEFRVYRGSTLSLPRLYLESTQGLP